MSVISSVISTNLLSDSQLTLHQNWKKANRSTRKIHHWKPTKPKRCKINWCEYWIAFTCWPSLGTPSLVHFNLNTAALFRPAMIAIMLLRLFSLRKCYKVVFVTKRSKIKIKIKNKSFQMWWWRIVLLLNSSSMS